MTSSQIGGYGKNKKYVKTDLEGRREYTMLLADGSTLGTYHAKTPQEAASKAYTNLCSRVKKEVGTNFTCPGQKITITEVGKNLKLNQKHREYSYYAERVLMDKPKVLTNRTYKYTNLVIPISKGQSIEDAKKRYQKRRQSAMLRYNRDNAQKIFKEKKSSKPGTKTVKGLIQELRKSKKVSK